MPELRKDYLLDRWVLISEKRGLRPRQFRKLQVVRDDRECYFCPGSEQLTPPEVGRVNGRRGWEIRWFPNKFPAVAKGSFRSAGKGMLASMSGYGSHLVVVETPDHSRQLADLSKKQIADVLRVYSRLITSLSKDRRTGYVVVFKNHGAEAGTSIVHSHTQVASVPVMPALVRQEVLANRKGSACRLCKVIRMERKTRRRIAETKNAIAIAPYASRFNYEAWILPKRHIRSLAQFSDAEYDDFAALLKMLLMKLGSLNASYNFFLHYSPSDFHFHIELAPRLATWAGFELCTDIVINSVSPESAAEFYRR